MDEFVNDYDEYLRQTKLQLTGLVFVPYSQLHSRYMTLISHILLLLTDYFRHRSHHRCDHQDQCHYVMPPASLVYQKAPTLRIRQS